MWKRQLHAKNQTRLLGKWSWRFAFERKALWKTGYCSFGKKKQDGVLVA